MIEFNNVTKQFGKTSTALEDINFSIKDGDFVFLVGPTGSGKTTIFRLIIHDLQPTTGAIIVGEWNITKIPKNKIPALRRKIGVVFQDLKLLMDRTVIENVMLPLQFTGVDDREAKNRSEEILMQVGLAEKQNKFPLQLSGGERQRVAIARALIFNPEVLLADEPTGNLDLQTSYQILELLQSINKRGTTIFMATHNEHIIEKTKDRVIVLERGRILHDKQSSESKQSLHSDETKKKEPEQKTEKKEENAS